MIAIHFKRYGLIAVTLLLFCACTSNRVTESDSERLDVSLVETISIDNLIVPDRFQSLADKMNISSKVSDNLASSGFPVASDKTPSHDLFIVVDAVQRSSTPVGFSFNAGDSDPRAQQFQKADVVTITCKLTSKQQPRQQTERTMTFQAKSLSQNPGSANSAEIAKQLSDQASTTCFNLLSQLEVDRQTKLQSQEDTGSSSDWMPTVEIRTVEEPGGEPVTSIEPNIISSPQPVQQVDTENRKPAKQVQQTQEQQDEPQPSVIVKKVTKKQRKQLLIHNQGNPVTIDFGFERK
ncbi:MAG: hypothetical protein K0U68_09890 [Gammaproteobacteria bacterium]|nr:hypothetical protein [Gammaproteobacteria bacterium]